MKKRNMETYQDNYQENHNEPTFEDSDYERDLKVDPLTTADRMREEYAQIQEAQADRKQKAEEEAKQKADKEQVERAREALLAEQASGSVEGISKSERSEAKAQHGPSD